MIQKNDAIDKYIAAQPVERHATLNELRNLITDNLPEGFQECLNYGMPSYVVPHNLFPRGYHCDPKLPLPFLSFANQKHFIALYHMGIYANTEMLEWFQSEYFNLRKKKPNMGKSCIRLVPTEVPVNIIRELLLKMTPKDWILLYESAIEKRK